MEASDLAFSNQIKWLQTDQKLFVVKHNGPIVFLFISREMGELQRRLNGRRRLDQVSVILIWLVLACNLSFSSSECLNDKWQQRAINIAVEARGDPSPLQLKNARRAWVAKLISCNPPVGPVLLAIPGHWVRGRRGSPGSDPLDPIAIPLLLYLEGGQASMFEEGQVCPLGVDLDLLFFNDNTWFYKRAVIIIIIIITISNSINNWTSVIHSWRPSFTFISILLHYCANLPTNPSLSFIMIIIITSIFMIIISIIISWLESNTPPPVTNYASSRAEFFPKVPRKNHLFPK